MIRSFIADPRGVAMATPPAAAEAMAALVPLGPVLELCCGAGGATLSLAARGPVVAVDKSPVRLSLAQANLAASGLAEQATFLACDLASPALAPLSSLFAACILDPDWAPHGEPPGRWSGDLRQMQPPADRLWEFAAGFSPCRAMRLPPGLVGLPPGRVLPVRKNGRTVFTYLMDGPWPALPDALAF